MTDKNAIDIKNDDSVEGETERTRECRCFSPRTDIFEKNEIIYIDLDMPGINENAIEITLEKNILNIKGYSQVLDHGDFSLVSQEYEPGDFERSFRISHAIDREKIKAIYTDGVLRLTLPKAEEAKSRKIEVKVK